MQTRIITILLFCFFKNILSFSAARTVDPITLALEQILSDITFEIVPYPTYPNICPTCSNFYDVPDQCGSYNPYVCTTCSNSYDVPNQYGVYNPNVCPTCSNFYDIPNQYGSYNPNVCGNPYDQCWQHGMEYGPNICTSPCDQYGMYGWEYGPNIYSSPMTYDQYGMYGWDYMPNVCDNPMPYDQCVSDTYPACNCYQDIKSPANMCEDSSYYICFDNYVCNKQTPYIYFPEVEYPMSAMAVSPYFYGSCWCI